MISVEQNICLTLHLRINELRSENKHHRKDRYNESANSHFSIPPISPRLVNAVAMRPRLFVHAGLSMDRTWLRSSLRRRVGGNLTPSTRLRRRGRDGKASKIGTAASWPRNIRNGREPFMPCATPPLITSLVTAGGAGGSHSRTAT